MIGKKKTNHWLIDESLVLFDSTISGNWSSGSLSNESFLETKYKENINSQEEAMVKEKIEMLYNNINFKRLNVTNRREKVRRVTLETK